MRLAFAVAMRVSVAAAPDRPVRIVVLGDSLTAGLGLRADETFPVKLEQALRAKGLSVEVANAGVSGDTASHGLSRLDWSVPGGTDPVIVDLASSATLPPCHPTVTPRAPACLLVFSSGAPSAVWQFLVLLAGR